MTNLRDEARWIIGEISEAKRLAKAGGKPQLANSAIEAGKIEEYDQDGTLVQVVGEQHDGTHAPVTVNGPVPPEPAPPALTAGIGSVEARWSGKFDSAALSPMDFSHVALHASRVEVFTPSNETQLATITGELGDVAVVLLEPGEWSFALVAVSKAGKWSEMSETVTVDVPDYPSPVDIQDELILLDEKYDGVITEAGNLGNRLDQAEEDLTAHEGRLGTAEQRVSEAFVQIDAADGKATAAASVAANAQSKADTAAQAAADAAGIASGKGKVLVQSTAPGTADRNAVTLWIDTTGGANTPKRWTSGTTWVAVTDKAATDAAAAAASAAALASAAQEAAGTAQATANNALSMAGSKSRVYYNTTAPSGTATQGDVWRQVDASKNVIAEWFYGVGGWTKSLVTTEMISNLDVGKLSVGTGVIADLVAQSIAASTAAFQTVDVKNLFVTTGTMTEAVINKLWADVVMSRKITAQMVAIGSFENLIPDDEFEIENGDVWYAPSAGTGSGFSTEITFGNAKKSMVLPYKTGNPSTAALYAAYLKPNYRVPVVPGETYYITSWVYLDAANIGNLTSVQQRVYHYAGRDTTIINALAGDSIAAPPVRTWFQIGGLFTVPAGSFYLSPRATAYYPNNADNSPAGGRWFFSAPKMVRASNGELIVDGSVKAKQIDTVNLAANTGFIADLTARIVKSEMFVGKEFQGGTFTGSVFQTSGIADVGLKLNGAGLRVYGSEGGEPVTEIRADGGTVYSITDPATGDTLATMGADGGIAGQALDIAQDPVFMGMPLLGSTTPDAFQSDQPGILDYLPRGNVAYAARNVAGIQCSNGNRALLEFSFDEVAGRSYQVTVQPVPITSTINTNSLLRLFSEVGASPGKPTFNSSEWYRFAAGGTVTTLIGGTFLHNAYGTGRRRVLVALFTGNQTTTILNQAAAANLRIVVTDIGPIFGEVGIDRNDSDENGVIVAPPPPAPEKKNYTKTYEATGWRSYKSDGSTYNYQTSRMYQGNSPAVGTLRSNAVFPSMISDLSGATITSVEAHFYFDHWYYPQGGTARIHLHKDIGGVDSTIAAQTYAVQSGNWKPGSGRWVKIPSQFWNGFKNGDYTGVGLGGTTTAQYGYARGSSTRIRIKYTK